MLKRWWTNFQAWRAYRHYKKIYGKSMKKYPRAYEPQGWEMKDYDG